MGGRDSQGAWGGHVHTAILKMNNQQGPTIQRRELCSMLCGRLDGRGVGIHGFPGSADGKASACTAGDPGSVTGWGGSSGVLATHSSTRAWKIPWTEEPGRLHTRGHKESDTTERLHFLSFHMFG